MKRRFVSTKEEEETPIKIGIQGVVADPKFEQEDVDGLTLDLARILREHWGISLKSLTFEIDSK